MPRNEKLSSSYKTPQIHKKSKIKNTFISKENKLPSSIIGDYLAKSHVAYMAEMSIHYPCTNSVMVALDPASYHCCM